MNKLQKIRRMIKESKKHSILYQFENTEVSRKNSLSKHTQDVKKTSYSTITPVSIFNLQSSIQSSTNSLNSQNQKIHDLNKTQTGLVLKLKKTQNCAPSLTMRQQRSFYYQTIKNVSSLIAKPWKADVRINEASKNRKSIKSIKTKVSIEDTLSVEDTKEKAQIVTVERPRKQRRSPRKIVCRSVHKEKRALSPLRQTSPMRGVKITAWQINEQPQLDWL